MDKKLSLSEKYKINQPKETERSLLKEKLQEKQSSDKIPQYSKLIPNGNGKLQCVVCNEVVKNANFWPKHLKSEEHVKVLTYLKNVREKMEKDEDVKITIKPGNNQKTTSVSVGKDSKNPFQGVIKQVEVFKKPDHIESKNKLKELMDQNQEGKDTEPKPLPKGFFDDPEKDDDVRQHMNKKAFYEEPVSSIDTDTKKRDIKVSNSAVTESKTDSKEDNTKIVEDLGKGEKQSDQFDHLSEEMESEEDDEDEESEGLMEIIEYCKRVEKIINEKNKKKQKQIKENREQGVLDEDLIEDIYSKSLLGKKKKNEEKLSQLLNDASNIEEKSNDVDLADILI